MKDIVMAWDKVSDKIELDGFKIKYRKSSGEPTFAPLNLFTVDEDLAKLPEKQKAAFHNVVAKALYKAKQAQPNIAVSIAFLTTQGVAQTYRIGSNNVTLLSTCGLRPTCL